MGGSALVDHATEMVFRTDASAEIGTGHLMRCLTLAGVMRERGASVSFVCREHKGHFCGLLEERGFVVTRLPAPSSQFRADDAPAHSAWLGAAWRDDADETSSAIKRVCVKADWLVVDHYAIDERWEAALRPLADRILAIDDIADRRHDCDLLLDQNLVPEMKTRYAGKVQAKTRLLLGPAYALLNPLYAEAHESARPRDGRVGRIFIFFGGSDSYDLTLRTISVLKRLNRSEVHADVVLPYDAVTRKAIEKEAAGVGNIELHSNLLTLVSLMANADLAIGGGGATTWERLCVGLPALVVTTAANQRVVGELLDEMGLIQLLGAGDLVDEARISEALNRLIENGIDPAWSLRCLETVDGKGVFRVVSALGIFPRTTRDAMHSGAAE